MGKRIVIIGAGSTNFGLKIIGDFYKSQILKGSTIVLHDIRPEAVEKTRKIAENYKEKLQVDFQIEATTSREEALKGADFCLISIEVGNRFELWEQDWGIPVEYGFKQIYGENGGPGGLFHALRIIPVIIEICDDIEKICPNAVVFNYSNPMQRICHALTTKFPNLNIIGLCHEIHSMERQLPTLLDTNLDNIEFEAGGLNHFSILLDVKYKDSKKDGYPIIRDKFNNNTLTNSDISDLSLIPNDVPQSQFEEIVREAVSFEKEFVKDALPVDLIGMNEDLMCQYIEAVADRIADLFEFDRVFNTENPFDFMRALDVQNVTNFFEKKFLNIKDPLIELSVLMIHFKWT